jgi:hypothetical protein
MLERPRLSSYVEEASRVVREQVKLPPGYAVLSAHAEPRPAALPQYPAGIRLEPEDT